ncbi:hypothetical protein AMATHDRAFT_75930 [Amanita thiersii Skay4041]|uniref:Uncharacterized protein n=1 Tax=Amanita thiersii Skay4041 TaxID=703135 RepID=A0A2A9NFZ4_9AGAR|nr:hypothetical protein AMATHDRAFT_75930 [Amanita thiersii Skay4041]
MLQCFARVPPLTGRQVVNSVRHLNYTTEGPQAHAKNSGQTQGKEPLQSIRDAVKETKSDELSLLTRPLGVRERPSIFKKTRTDRIKELMNDDALIEQRRHLVKEASKSYFHDLNMTRRHGGKTWIAPKVLIREDKALYLPNIYGKSLDEGIEKSTTAMCFGRITVLAMLSTKISELQAEAFVRPTHERFSSNRLYQYIQINLQENLLKSFLVNLFRNSLRSSIPKELQSSYLISSQNMEYVRDAMGMTNSRVGYMYLIDENLKIRWGAGADPTAEERQSLENCTGVLLKRLETSRDRKT